MAKLLLSSCIVLALAAVASVFASECAHRNYGNGGTVCVCNATYCDNLKPIEKTAKGVITSYVTSLAGDRFARSELHFGKEVPTHVASAVSVTVDPGKKYQKIIGFGGAFTDSTGINIAKLPAELQTRLIKDYFASDGIEYTLGRIPIGGTDFSTRAYSYDDNPVDETLASFALQPEDIKYKIPYLHLAKEVSSNQLNFYASPWSPPAWMKTNKKIHNGGFLIGAPGGKYYKLYAKYLVKFLQEYNKQNVSIWAITIANEPEAGFIDTYKWNSLAFNQTLQRDFIKMDLGPELAASGYSKDKLKVMIQDGQLPMLKGFAETILADKEAGKYVSGIAFHWYWNSFANRQDLDDVNKMFPEYFLLGTEACEEHSQLAVHVSLGNWTMVNRYADDIIKDLNHYTTGWTDWNMALDTQGGPTWAENFVDAPIIVNATSQEYYKQPIFYVMGHFSKFLVPNSVRLGQVVQSKEEDAVLLTVFERPDGGTVLTVLNKNKHSTILQAHDPRNGYFDLNVKAESLQTLIWY